MGQARRDRKARNGGERTKLPTEIGKKLDRAFGLVSEIRDRDKTIEKLQKIVSDRDSLSDHCDELRIELDISREKSKLLKRELWGVRKQLRRLRREG